ncbi:DUF1153 domain-containing protein [Tropicimonas sp. IMCC34011]|uniref:CtrA inhibitor SciP n=1 Tax=Tropicimonas sp. IMCC34011 TaxID=2248759 RepID=UPI000E2523F2|nr:DUF1153 domain-containing protein [Tropicimonas sp. IMCC34011]
MFIKKVDGPRAVKLPDGTMMTRADLPEAGTRRWVASRKAAVVRAVRHGLITAEGACERYGLSAEELESWSRAVETHGEAALRTTALKRYRDYRTAPEREGSGQT